MINNNSALFSFFNQFGKRIKKFIKLLQKTSKKNYLIFQRFQLSFIYFFALVVLIYTVINSLGYFPEFLFKFFPFLEPILDIKILQILATPEKTFILYLIIIELLLNRSTFSFSILIKYNVLLIFILEMLQNLLITYWDLLFTREFEVFNGTTVVLKSATMMFFSFLFILNFCIYFYSFFQSFKGNIPIFKGPFKFLSDSVAFWLQIKPRKEK
jgi:lysylphosphatidylglycerol synthetase-like protein (DUF2156 family)